MTIGVDAERRCALVTGAAGGLGSAIARRLAADGHRLILLDAAPAAETLAAELRDGGADARAEIFDLGKLTEVGRLVERLNAEGYLIDVLVNNAGIGSTREVGDTRSDTLPLSEWNKVLAINLSASFALMQACLPAMLARRWGRIVNMSSRAGRTAIRGGDVAYAASKAGLIGITRHIAMEVGSSSVTVNAIAPGRFDTALARRTTPERLAASLAAIPVGRVGDPDEVAALTSFLVSEHAGYITGAVIDINGGAFIG